MPSKLPAISIRLRTRAICKRKSRSLLLEVNNISQNTNFNGQPLLDGSHAGFQPYVDASFNVSANAVLASNIGTGTGNLIAGVTATATFDTTAAAGGQDGTIELQVVNTSSNSVAVQVTFLSSATNFVSAVNGTFLYGQTVTVDGLTLSIGNITVADAGTTAYVKVSQAVAASTNANAPALSIQSGADEGDTVQIGIQATNAQTLRISNINVAVSSSGNGSIGAEDAIGQIDNALNTLLGQRAQLGAVIVRLNEDANNDSVAAVNLQASESAIRDLNVGQATTEFTKSPGAGASRNFRAGAIKRQRAVGSGSVPLVRGSAQNVKRPPSGGLFFLYAGIGSRWFASQR